MCHLYIYPPHYCMFIALVFLAHIYVDLIVSATNVLVVFLSTINKHFLLLLLLAANTQMVFTNMPAFNWIEMPNDRKTTTIKSPNPHNTKLDHTYGEVPSSCQGQIIKGVDRAIPNNGNTHLHTLCNTKVC